MIQFTDQSVTTLHGTFGKDNFWVSTITPVHGGLVGTGPRSPAVSARYAAKIAADFTNVRRDSVPGIRALLHHARI
jgi:hypothetical protein